MGWIYKIENLINNKVYIGKTERDVSVRWKEHIRHINSLIRLPLYKALKKYDIKNFSVEVLEECDNLKLDERECYWIKQYNSYGKNGYNCSYGGEGRLKISEETLENIALRYQNGEYLTALCKEYSHDYETIRARLEKLGIKINSVAGPQKLSKIIYCIDPNNNQTIKKYNSITEASKDICSEGRSYRAISNHISKYKNTQVVSHGYLWRTKEFYE